MDSGSLEVKGASTIEVPEAPYLMTWNSSNKLRRSFFYNASPYNVTVSYINERSHFHRQPHPFSII